MKRVRRRDYEKELAGNGNLIYTNLGVGMLPILQEKRDLLIVEKKGNKRCRKYDAVLYRREDGTHMLHRVLKVRNEDYVLCGDNCWQREYGIRDEQIIGVLAGFVQNDKTIPVTDIRYRCYVHLWCDFYYIRAGILFVRDLLFKGRG